MEAENKDEPAAMAGHELAPMTRADLLHLATIYTGGTKRDDETTWRHSHHEKVVHAYTGSSVVARRLLARAAEREDDVVSCRMTVDAHGNPDGLFISFDASAVRGFQMMVKGPPRKANPNAFGRGAK